jgi:cytochrome c oxidase subunit II
MNFPMAPDGASNFAGPHDAIFYVLVALTLFFTLVVGACVVYFALKYRQGKKVDRSRPVHEHMKLEVTWSVIPLFLALVMFYFGAALFIDMRRPPANAMDVFVVGKQWMWHIQHPSGVRENNTLHVPVGKPVRLTMISQDVLHAFYVPEFRIQYHVVPGRYAVQWFTATKPGKYRILCGMYCGTQHSEMGGYVYAMKPEEYAKWIQNGGNMVGPQTAEERGEVLYAKLGCNNCHTEGDTERGPALFDLAAKMRARGAATNVADHTYLRENILDPWKTLTPGYTNTMPAYAEQIAESDLLDLIAYIRGLGNMPLTRGGASDDPQKGSSMDNTFINPEPRMSVGSLGAREGVREDTTGSSLAAGSLLERSR